MYFETKKTQTKKINFAKYFKTAEICLIIGLIVTVLLSFCRFDAACADLRENVLRLHIRANSDSDTDQNLKLAVRDAVLSKCDTVFYSCDSLEEAVVLAKENIDILKLAAEETVKEKGFSYGVNVYIGESYFDTRVYDTFTLPAGKYESLIIDIGEGKGHNWWCVVFPSVCLPAASNASLGDTAKDYSAYIASNPQKYICRFKVVEWYESLKNRVEKQ